MWWWRGGVPCSHQWPQPRPSTHSPQPPPQATLALAAADTALADIGALATNLASLDTALGAVNLTALAAAARVAPSSLDVSALRPALAGAATAAAQAHGAGAAAVGGLRSDGLAAVDGFVDRYEERTRAGQARARALALAATIGALGGLVLVVGALAAADRTPGAAAACGVALWLAVSVSVAAGWGGVATARGAAADACAYSEAMAVRLAAQAGGERAAAAARYYLDAAGSGSARGRPRYKKLYPKPDPADPGASAPAAAGDDVLLDAFGVDVAPLRAARTDPTTGSALALLRLPAAKALLARSRLPPRVQSDVLGLPSLVDSANLHVTQLEAAIAAPAFRPALDAAKRLPCCTADATLQALGTPWVVAGGLGGVVAGLAVGLACTAAPRRLRPARGGKARAAPPGGVALVAWPGLGDEGGRDSE